MTFTLSIGAFEPEDFESEATDWKHLDFAQYIAFALSEHGEATATSPDRDALVQFIAWYCNGDVESAVSMAFDVTTN